MSVQLPGKGRCDVTEIIVMNDIIDILRQFYANDLMKIALLRSNKHLIRPTIQTSE